MVGLFLQIREVAPEVTSIFPPNLWAYVTGAMALVAFTFVLYDRTTGKGKLDADIRNEMKMLGMRIDACAASTKALENTDGAVGAKLAELSQKISEVLIEVRGFDGTNGHKGRIKKLESDIVDIKERNRKMDILAALYEQDRARYEGPERRETMRRLELGRREEDKT